MLLVRCLHSEIDAAGHANALETSRLLRSDVIVADVELDQRPWLLSPMPAIAIAIADVGYYRRCRLLSIITVGCCRRCRCRLITTDVGCCLYRRADVGCMLSH
jgi:hypothetical protein